MRADGARRLRRFRVAQTPGSDGKARKLRTVKRPQGRAPAQILTVGALNTYLNVFGGSGVGIRIPFGLRHSDFGILQ